MVISYLIYVCYSVNGSLIWRTEKVLLRFLSSVSSFALRKSCFGARLVTCNKYIRLKFDIKCNKEALLLSFFQFIGLQPFQIMCIDRFKIQSQQTEQRIGFKLPVITSKYMCMIIDLHAQWGIGGIHF